MKLRDFLIKLKNKVAELFGKLKKTAQKVIPIGIEVTNFLKKIADSPKTDAFVLATETKVDDIVLAAMKNILPVVLRELGEWNESVNKTDGELIKDAATQINSYIKAKKDFTNLGIASLINAKLSEGEMTLAQSVTATQEAYNNPELLNA